MLLSQAVSKARGLANIAKIAMDESYTNSEFERMVQSLPSLAALKSKAEPKWDAVEQEWVSAHGRSVNNWEFTRDSIYDEWATDKERFGCNKWAAYNAIQGAEQHYLNAGSTGSAAKAQARAFQSALITPKAPIAAQAWTHLGLNYRIPMAIGNPTLTSV